MPLTRRAKRTKIERVDRLSRADDSAVSGIFALPPEIWTAVGEKVSVS